jgi:hypothetical protein
MTQEVQIIITAEADTTMSKEDIKNFINSMARVYTAHGLTTNLWKSPNIISIEVKEEAEIYGNT